MITRRYKVGQDRQQVSLLPPSLEEYVSDNSLVRAIDLYVDSLDLAALGFHNTETSNLRGDGQPAYSPNVLMKLYLYGYLNRLRTSRLLEREACLNVELMWLLQELKPSHATIANFRKRNLKAIKSVNRDFVKMCRELDLYGGTEVGIDGTFMHGNASKASIYTKDKLDKTAEWLAKEIAQIEDYFAQLEQNDAQEQDLPPISTEDAALAEKLERLKTRQQRCHQRQETLEASGEKQLSETDPDARLLNKRGQTIAGYNVQIAVDSKYKLLLNAEVVTDGNDIQQLEPMALAAKEALGVDSLIVDADAGYDNPEQINNCLDNDITPYVPTVNREKAAKEKGRFSHSDFSYDAETDTYRCPEEQVLTFQGIQSKKSNDGKKVKTNYKYASQSSVCATCPQRTKCLPEKTGYRQIYRSEYATVMEQHRARMKAEGKEHMRTRSALAEHPFGTMKIQMGWQHFLLRGLDKVRAEMDLQMLSYNFKRVFNLIGIAAFKNHLNAWNKA